jgi:hypothetical protein
MLNEIFKPKNKDDVLFEIAKGRYSNRALLIGVYEKHPDLFDTFFNSLMKVPNFEIEAILKVLYSRSEFNVALGSAFDAGGRNDALKVIRIFKSLKFDTSKFKIETIGVFSNLKVIIVFNDSELLKHYNDLSSQYAIKKKKRKKRQAKKPLGF